MKSFNNQADSALQTILNLDQKPERIQSEIAIEEMRWIGLLMFQVGPMKT